jgi:hypothetical protein
MSVPAGPQQPVRVPHPAGRPVGASPADFRRKAHARLAPLADPVRSRHKPLSLLRMEARRLLEQFFDTEAAALTRAERDKLADELLTEEPGLGPLEELFRDPAVREVMLLGPGQVIVRKADGWTPTSVRFRDAEQLRQVLARHAEVGEPVAAGPAAAGGFDVWLGSGFRLVGVVPPEVLDAPPTAVFVRGERPAPAPSQPAQPAAGSGTQSAAESRPTATGPGAVRTPSGRLSPPADRPDPYAGVRQQVTRRIITGFATAGVHDLSRIPPAELRKIVLAYVEEYCEVERLWSDEAFRERLALEILAGMNR